MLAHISYVQIIISSIHSAQALIYIDLLLKILLHRCGITDGKEHQSLVMVYKSKLVGLSSLAVCVSCSVTCKITHMQHLSCKHWSLPRVMKKL